jgi:hypothetical protein
MHTDILDELEAYWPVVREDERMRLPATESRASKRGVQGAEPWGESPQTFDIRKELSTCWSGA